MEPWPALVNNENVFDRPVMSCSRPVLGLDHNISTKEKGPFVLAHLAYFIFIYFFSEIMLSNVFHVDILINI